MKLPLENSATATALTKTVTALTICLALAVNLASAQQMNVDGMLGALPLGGSLNVAGNTADGANNADYYEEIADPTGNWGNELVFEFEVLQVGQISVTLNAASTGDPDFILLRGLDTAASTEAPGKRVAIEPLGWTFLDTTTVGVTEAITGTSATLNEVGVVQPGMYYLVVDSFLGNDGNVVGGDTVFDVTLNLGSAPEPPADFVDLSDVQLSPDEPFILDTVGSEFDTELGLFDENGALVLSNDDIDVTVGNFQSRLDLFLGLPRGEYWVALGGHDTIFGVGWGAVSVGVGGDYDFNLPGGSLGGNLLAQEIVWFRFSIEAPVDDPAPVFTAVQSDGINTTITWESLPGHTYLVEGSPDMQTWTPIVTDFPSSGVPTTFIDAPDGGVGRGDSYYFRVEDLGENVLQP